MRVKQDEAVTVRVPEGAKKMRISVSKSDPGYMHINFTPVNMPKGGEIPEGTRPGMKHEPEFVETNLTRLKMRRLQQEFDKEQNALPD